MTLSFVCCCCSHENFHRLVSCLRWTDDQLGEVWQRAFLVWKWSWCWSYQMGLNDRTSHRWPTREMKSPWLCCWRRCGIRWWHECGKILGVDDVVVEIWRWWCHDWYVRPTFMWVDSFYFTWRLKSHHWGVPHDPEDGAWVRTPRCNIFLDLCQP